MPVTTRACVRTSIACLAVGAILGALMLIGRWLPLGAAIAYLRVPHVHLLIVGWLTQLILGVAWWLFPPLGGTPLGGTPLGGTPLGATPSAASTGAGPRRGQARRGSERLFWTTYGLLNAAVLLRAVCDPLYSITHAAVFGVLIALSGVCLALAALTFVANMWPRVRELTGHR